MPRVASALLAPGELLLWWWLISRLDKPLWCWPVYKSTLERRSNVSALQNKGDKDNIQGLRKSWSPPSFALPYLML